MWYNNTVKIILSLLLIENQSTVAKDMPERLLRYMISIWAEEIRNGVEKLPAIIPIVVYNGLDRRWEVPKDIVGAFDIFKNDIFKYKVVDIAQVDIKSYLGVELMGEFVSNVARLLDETKTKEFLAGVQQGIQQGIQQERRETAKRMIQLGISYEVISKATNLSIEEIEKIAREQMN